MDLSRGGRAATPPSTARTQALRRNLLAGLLLGVGAVAFLDEAVFHQLLHWHKFYDRASTELGLVSDGLFHAFSWGATVAALFLLGSLRRDRVVDRRRVVGGALVGAGAFQLYDGLVQHKLLGLHQIRYEVDLLPYDLVWNALAVALLVAGLVLVRRSARA
ncbi:DUF2243 domain-containing protein [Pseudonocardia lacus]|uniref:DUF2243 domain-containing protein n=1 Tax=Pseudonocardia lacus TaxID=2835865 RepID=UPI00202941EB|nr:DUF2243 domain-containing protein [Pseudonocardia lacus]